MRTLSTDAAKYEKDTDSYEVLMNGFTDLKVHRDEIGKPLRGLKGTRIVILGEEAMNHREVIVAAAIDHYIRRSPEWKAQIKDKTVYAYFRRDPDRPTHREPWIWYDLPDDDAARSNDMRLEADYKPSLQIEESSEDQ